MRRPGCRCRRGLYNPSRLYMRFLCSSSLTCGAFVLTRTLSISLSLCVFLCLSHSIFLSPRSTNWGTIWNSLGRGFCSLFNSFLFFFCLTISAITESLSRQFQKTAFSTGPADTVINCSFRWMIQSHSTALRSPPPPLPPPPLSFSSLPVDLRARTLHGEGKEGRGKGACV